MGIENCLAVSILATKYGFRDENCASSLRYICYARETIGMTTAGKHTQKECALIFGIDESNFEHLKNIEI